MAAAKPEAIALDSLGVSPVRLRTHWATKLEVGTVNLEKGRKLQYSLHLSLLHTFTLLLLLHFLILSLSSSLIARYVAASGLAAVIYISGFPGLCVKLLSIDTTDLHNLENMRKVVEITFLVM